MQDIVYIRLPPRINFGILSKRYKITEMGYFWSPLDQILQKINSGKSRITPHTSHITYYIGICKFYKILVINTVLTFNNSSKLILKNFDKYFFVGNHHIDNTNSYVRSNQPFHGETRHFLKVS